MIDNGNHSKIRHERGVLVEYNPTSLPLIFAFEFNPSTLSRTRRVTRTRTDLERTQGETDFSNPDEAQRAAQGYSVEAETLSLTILLDATDRMNRGDPIASRLGVQPEIDTLRSMLEPKSQIPAGMARLEAIGAGNDKAFSRQHYPSLLVFKWGPHVLPVFMTEVRVAAREHLPDLHPYRAEVTILLEVIEGKNPLYDFERKRQLAAAAGHSSSSLVSTLSDWLAI